LIVLSEISNISAIYIHDVKNITYKTSCR